MVCVDDTPDWLLPLILHCATHSPANSLPKIRPARQIADRQAAVLILLGRPGPDRADVVLIQRAPGLRDHPGEI